MQLGRCEAPTSSIPIRLGQPVQHVPQHVTKIAERAKMASLAPARNLKDGRWEEYRQRFFLPSALPAGKHVHGGLGQKRNWNVPKAGEMGVSGALLQKKREVEAATVTGRDFRAGSIVAASIAPPPFSPSRLLSAYNAVSTPSEPVSEPQTAAADGVAAPAPSESVYEAQAAAADDIAAPAEPSATAVHATSKLAHKAQTIVSGSAADPAKRVAPVRPKSRRQKDCGAFLTHKDLLALVKDINSNLSRKMQAKNLKQMTVAQLDEFLDAHKKVDKPDGLAVVSPVGDGQPRLFQGVGRDAQRPFSEIRADEALWMRREVHKHRILSLQQKAASMAEHSQTLHLQKIRDLLRLKKDFEGLKSTEMVDRIDFQLEELHKGLPQVGFPPAQP
jgi:hypothetical protein